MEDAVVLPELKEILGAMILASKEPLSPADMLRVLRETSEAHGEHTAAFAQATQKDVEAALEQMGRDLAAAKTGIHLGRIASGYRLLTDGAASPWLRQLLGLGRRQRLSRPALETLAVIAYRQPVTRHEIESVRGVGVDHVIRALMEMQLVRIVGRSNLPGRPMQLGTTQIFLEHFGLNSVRELPGIDELARIEALSKQAREDARQQEARAATAEPGAAATGEPAAGPEGEPPPASAAADAPTADDAAPGVEAAAEAEAGTGADEGAEDRTGDGTDHGPGKPAQAD